MSYASTRYSQYSTFFSPLLPYEDYWDQQIHSHTTEELLLIVSEGTCTIDSNGNTYQIPTPAFIWNRAGSYHLISNVKKGDRPSYVASFLPSILADIPPKLLRDIRRTSRKMNSIHKKWYLLEAYTSDGSTVKIKL